MITKKIKAKGMHGTSCEKLIENIQNEVTGIETIKANYATETVNVTFDETKTTLEEIKNAIEKKGYECSLIEDSSISSLIEDSSISDKNMITKKIKAKGMHCTSCEKLIENIQNEVTGIETIKANYATETVNVTFDETKTTLEEIKNAIEKKGYECSLIEDSSISSLIEDSSISDKKNWFGWAFGAIGLLIAGYFVFNIIEGVPLPEISPAMGYGLLFLVGLLTGFHCIAMCGGFVLGYTAKNAQEGKKSHLSHLMYGLGKTVSYTIIGALFGLLGSYIAFTPTIRGVAGIIAGIFLIIFGLNMLNIFPILRKIQLRTPGFISKFVNKESKQSKSPLIIGLLNGLMIACGPLQAIYIMAAGTGSMVEGAKLLFIFGLGTLPVMLGFGYFASFISSKMTHNILKASGVIMLILGLIMLNNGLVLSGTGYDITSILGSVVNSQGGVNDQNSAIVKEGFQEINMEVNRNGWTPDKFILKKGVPVKWNINVKELTGCNNEIIVNDYKLDIKLKNGLNVVEFTPDKVGIIPWSCWMGMLRGSFIVTEDGEAIKQDATAQPAQKVTGNAVSSAVPNNGVQEVNMGVDGSGYTPKVFVLKKGVPVKWNVDVKRLTGCNSQLIARDYNVNKRLKEGLNVIEFTPDKIGTFTFSCSMNMLRGNFIVTETGTATQQEVTAATPKTSGGSCSMGAGGGGCGCGRR